MIYIFIYILSIALFSIDFHNNFVIDSHNTNKSLKYLSCFQLRNLCLWGSNVENNDNIYIEMFYFSAIIGGLHFYLTDYLICN